MDWKSVIATLISGLLTKLVPFLGNPLIGWLVSLVVGWLSGILGKMLETWLAKKEIESEVHKQLVEMKAATEALNAAQKAGVQNREKIKSDFKSAARKFAKLDLRVRVS